MPRTWIGLAILLWAATSARAAQSAPAGGQTGMQSYSSTLESAAWLAEEEKVDEAGEKYAQAAQAAPSQQEKVEVWLDWADLLSRNLGEEGGEGVAAQRVAKAEEIYRAALSEAQGDLRLRAYNDFGVFLLRRGEAGQASKVLGEIAETPWPGEDGPALRARYLYNFGQALELSRHEAAAYPRYLEAMRLDPQFSPSRKAAIRLASRPATAGQQGLAAPSLQLVKELLDQKHLAEAEGSLRLLTENPGRLGVGDRELFVDLLLRYLTEAGVEPGEFTQSWKEGVEGLISVLASPAGDRLRDIRDAYLAELPVELRSPGEPGTRFHAWSDGSRVRPFSNFLKMVGDAYATREDLRRSLQRYSQAVSLDPTNSAARLYLTNLLVSYSDQLDPEGELLDRWQAAGVEAERVRDPQDLKNYVHLHSLLGEHFEQEDPSTALVHLRRAVEIEERIAGASPSPVLHERLGAVYAAVGNLYQARREDRAAAAGYRSLGEPGKARELLTRSADRMAAVADTDTYAGYGEGTDSQDDQGSLPHTASPWPLIGLGCLACLAAALGIHILKRRSRPERLPRRG